jgi:hypothetical protein
MQSDGDVNTPTDFVRAVGRLSPPLGMVAQAVAKNAAHNPNGVFAKAIQKWGGQPTAPGVAQPSSQWAPQQAPSQWAPQTPHQAPNIAKWAHQVATQPQGAKWAPQQPQGAKWAPPQQPQGAKWAPPQQPQGAKWAPQQAPQQTCNGACPLNRPVNNGAAQASGDPRQTQGCGAKKAAQALNRPVYNGPAQTGYQGRLAQARPVYNGPAQTGYQGRPAQILNRPVEQTGGCSRAVHSPQQSGSSCGLRSAITAQNAELGYQSGNIQQVWNLRQESLNKSNSSCAAWDSSSNSTFNNLTDDGAHTEGHPAPYNGSCSNSSFNWQPQPHTYQAPSLRPSSCNGGSAVQFKPRAYTALY